MDFNSKYEAVIGLEVHAQLNTKSKIFCSCSTQFGNEPNKNVCPVCLGHPGVLPVLNKQVVVSAVLLGLACNCDISGKSVIARKNYFYPDLPKGYQISQYEEPICLNGHLEISTANGLRKIGITRIHIEEDAGKSIHDADSTLVDVNRCGVPLLEIVSEPDIRTAEEAANYLMKLRQIVQYLDICDGNMEEGSLRCDANISVREKGSQTFGTKTEIKNMNSFRNVERAINFEIERQIDMVENGEQVIQQTLLWDADLNEAHPMRSKEDAHDYRYFPEPDLFTIIVNEIWKNEIYRDLPELPDKRKKRFVKDFNLPEYDSEILTLSKPLADYYESVIRETNDYKSASNWVMVDVMKILNEEKINITDFNLHPERLGKLINLINDGTISNKIARELFPELIKSGKEPDVIIKEKNLGQISDINVISRIVQSTLEKNATETNEYINGTEKIFSFFIGKIMKETSGKANPKMVNEILRQQLEALKAEHNKK
ncbi:MAG: Asp-tRNA(Asn)/Glu-tRNA(Gln) amidotransferase subunit GatB [Ignavibacteriales bacterium]|nr:MAG: Asp-tRNA(Asn)/Glu-tRNA(Gln) amidotransferase subunit GatB [Ignavibacteriales bacterium]